jgi:DNA-binding NarL/FixJ family response regulator
MRPYFRSANVPEIRVLLSEMPPMLRDILHDALRDDTEIRIVGEVERHAGAAAVASSTGAHVVVTGETGPDERVRCRLLVVRRAGDRNTPAPTDEVKLHEEPLGDVSPGELVEAIRHAVAARTEEKPWRHS